jgi:hypothetical protein
MWIIPARRQSPFANGRQQRARQTACHRVHVVLPLIRRAHAAASTSACSAARSTAATPAVGVHTPSAVTSRYDGIGEYVPATICGRTGQHGARGGLGGGGGGEEIGRVACMRGGTGPGTWTGTGTEWRAHLPALNAHAPDDVVRLADPAHRRRVPLVCAARAVSRARESSGRGRAPCTCIQPSPVASAADVKSLSRPPSSAVRTASCSAARNAAARRVSAGPHPRGPRYQARTRTVLDKVVQPRVGVVRAGRGGGEPAEHRGRGGRERGGEAREERERVARRAGGRGCQVVEEVGPRRVGGCVEEGAVG